MYIIFLGFWCWFFRVALVVPVVLFVLKILMGFGWWPTDYWVSWVDFWWISLVVGSVLLYVLILVSCKHIISAYTWNVHCPLYFSNCNQEFLFQFLLQNVLFICVSLYQGCFSPFLVSIGGILGFYSVKILVV